MCVEGVVRNWDGIDSVFSTHAPPFLHTFILLIFLSATFVQVPKTTLSNWMNEFKRW